MRSSARTDPPWWLRPASWIGLGILLTALAWMGVPTLREATSATRPAWPWHVLGEVGSARGFVDPVVVGALGGALLLLVLLVSAFLPARPWRGASLFVLVGLGAILFGDDPIRGVDAATGSLRLVAALTAGAVLLRDAGTSRRGGAALLFGLLVLFAGLLFVPRIGAGSYAPYDPRAFDLLRPFRALAAAPPERASDAWGLDRIWSADGLHVVGLVLLLLLALVSRLGARGRWVAWAAPLLVAVTALVPIVSGAPAMEPGSVDLLHGLAAPEWNASLGMTVVFLAGLLSLVGLRGRWTSGIAAGGLGILTVLVASSAWAAATAAHPHAGSLARGLEAASRWLGPGLVALLPLLAAGVLDQAGGYIPRTKSTVPSGQSSSR